MGRIKKSESEAVEGVGIPAGQKVELVRNSRRSEDARGQEFPQVRGGNCQGLDGQGFKIKKGGDGCG